MAEKALYCKQLSVRPANGAYVIIGNHIQELGTIAHDLTGTSAVTPDERLSYIAAELRDAKPTNPLSVREFMSWFGAYRRGYYVVQRIRRHLERAGVETHPDFESAYIDSSITFSLAGDQVVPPAPPTEAPPPPTEPATSAPPSPSAAYADPTYRLSKLAAANKPPVFVRPDSTLQQAITLMLANDYSQLPVMTTERDVKGVISWRSIGTRLALGRSSAMVRELMDEPHEISIDASLFSANRHHCPEPVRPNSRQR